AGFLSSVIDSLPESEQQSATELFAQLGLTTPVLGATTPDNLYPTDVYSLTADGWTNWGRRAQPRPHLPQPPGIARARPGPNPPPTREQRMGSTTPTNRTPPRETPG